MSQICPTGANDMTHDAWVDVNNFLSPFIPGMKLLPEAFIDELFCHVHVAGDGDCGQIVTILMFDLDGRSCGLSYSSDRFALLPDQASLLLCRNLDHLDFRHEIGRGLRRLRCKSTSHLFPAKALAALAALALAEGNIPKVACALHCLRGVKEPHAHGARVDARGGLAWHCIPAGSRRLRLAWRHCIPARSRCGCIPLALPCRWGLH
mmetsp:Transcript_37489/g.76611  ORF Transcript_37489/g.76611 Transcript_37489/m.76611 type:complete len:207 (-) Transcript_37489:55-675(-)